MNKPIGTHIVRDVQNNRKHLKYTNKQFNTLCNNVEGACVLTNDALRQMHIFQEEHNELIPQFTSVSSKLQDGISHLLTQVENLIEISRLYAEAFQDENSSFNKLEAQNKILHRELDIAVRKLEMLSARNSQLEVQCVRNKWERLFLKVGNFKEGSIGWRHVVNQYKNKLGKKESVAYLFRNLDSKESCKDSDRSSKRRLYKKGFQAESSGDASYIDDCKFHIDLNSTETIAVRQETSGNDGIKITHHRSPDLLSDTCTNLQNDNNTLFEESYHQQKALNPSENLSGSHHNSLNFSKNDSISHQSYLNVLENIDVDDSHWNGSEMLENFTTFDADKSSTATIENELVFKSNLGESSVFEWISKNSAYQDSSNILANGVIAAASDKTKSKSIVQRHSNPKALISDSSNKSKIVDPTMMKNESRQSDIAPIEMKHVSTSTEELISYFHLRIIDPPCLNGKPVFYIITFDDQIKRGYFQVTNPYELDASLECVETEPNTVGKFCFEMKSNPEGFEGALKERVLRIALHENPSSSMFAFTSANINELNIFTNEELEEDVEKFSNELQLHFSFQDALKELTNFTNCLGITCSVSQKIKINVLEKSTETAPYEELVSSIIQSEESSYHKRCKDVYTETIEKGFCSENEMKSLKKELVELRKISGNIPCNKNAVSNLSITSSPDKKINFESSASKMNKKSRKYCESLPKDFFARLDMFREESEKHQENLQKKLTEKNQKELSKRLEAEKKLCTVDGNPSSSDNCLPAVFLPLKSNIVYKVRARSYFHPSNQLVRITQPPSIFQLPELRKLKSGELLGICVESDDGVENN